MIDQTRSDLEQLQKSSDDPQQRPLKPFEAPVDWQDQARQCLAASQPLQIFICGPKGSGKSSLTRFLSNALQKLREVKSDSKALYLLDLDPGQPEFTCPGELSLIKCQDYNLGFPFTHPRASPEAGHELIRSQFVGNLSPRTDPDHYYECCIQLFKLYKKLCKNEDDHAHVIVNTPGWVQGTGLDILSDLIRTIRPDKVIFTSKDGPEEAVDTLEDVCAQAKVEFNQVSSQPYSEVARSASDLRSMQTMSYFHLDPAESGQLRWNSRLLNDTKALIVPYTGPKAGIFAVQILGDEQKPDLYESILHGSVVGIAILEVNNPPKVQLTPRQLPYIDSQPLKPIHTRCLGQAYIRDIATQCFHLITPIPGATIHKLWTQGAKIVLVKGHLDTPTWAYKEEIEYEKSTMSKGEDEEVLKENIQRIVSRQPYLELVTRGKAAKARKIRRDIKYKPAGE